MTEIITRPENGVVAFNPTHEKVELIRRTIAPDVTADEFEMFLAYCRRTNLDPIARQIYIIVRGRAENRKATIQTSIDGFRLIAQRTGRYRGRVGPHWCGPDGQWVDVWLSDDYPAAAKVGVRLSDSDEITWAVCRWKDFVQKDKDGAVTQMWHRMSAHMLAKVAESQALRAALPGELSGLYTDDEMGQASNVEARGIVEHRPTVRDLKHTAAARPKPTRAQLETWYRGLCDKADVLGVPAVSYDPAWSDRDLILKGNALNKAIKEKEATIPPSDEPAPDGLEADE